MSGKLFSVLKNLKATRLEQRSGDIPVVESWEMKLLSLSLIKENERMRDDFQYYFTFWCVEGR